MPPKGRGKSAKRPRRQTASFGELELETPPTSRQLRSSHAQKSPLTEPAEHTLGSGSALCANVNASPAEPEQFEDGVEDSDLIQMECSIPDKTQSQPVLDFWSEAGSLTRRSSPLRVGDSGPDIWEFGEKDSIDPFSSPRPGVEILADTLPLPPVPAFDTQTRPQVGGEGRIDFSETASTMRRSSPLAVFDSTPDLWQFQENSSPRASLGGSLPTNIGPKVADSNSPASPPVHLPIDEIYDATPPGSKTKKTISVLLPLPGTAHVSQQRFCDPTPPQTSQKEVAVENTRARKGKAKKDMVTAELASDDEEPTPCPGKAKPDKYERNISIALHEEVLPDTKQLAHDSPTVPQETMRGKKRKQRAKTPIQFDEATQEVKDIPRKKKTNAPPSVTIVSALKNATKASVSPVTTTRKRPAPKAASKPEPPKKKRKGPAVIEKQTEPATTNSDIVASAVNLRDDAKLKRPTEREREDKDQNQEAMDVEPIAVEQETRILSAAPEIIVLSSDAESSELSDLEASPPSQPVPPKAPRGKKRDQATNRKSFSPLEEPKMSQKVSLDPEQASPSQSKDVNLPVEARLSDTYEQDRNDSRRFGANEAPKAIQRTTRSMKKTFTKGTVEAKVLAPRDPNRAPKQTLRSPQHKALQKAKAMKRSEAAQTPSLRKVARLSRTYSISEAGSPVPFESDQAPLTHDPSPWDRDIPEVPRD
ncbi:hypothetical protein AK830_g1236 [Neonectria ditissima]|uniref:Uncharacterized protein n=1 Tax=Neonectria ditissima TaxID=78410 RepID=A0A0P7BFK5_9HYPO|nr:hypothetical protein AK830_g1236 [Neonectria ditissima]